MLSRLKYGVLAIGAALLVTGGSGIASVSAQDASPTPAECVSPGLPEGSPTPMDMASPAAEAGHEMEVPVAPEVPAGTPADDATAAEIVAFVENYVACLNAATAAADPSLYVGLWSAAFVMESTGTGNPWDAVASEGSGPGTVVLQAVNNPVVLDDGSRAANAEVLINDHWLANVHMTIVDEEGTWKYGSEMFQTADTSFASGVTVMGIDIVETTDESTGAVTYAFQFLGAPTAVQNEVITLNIANQGVELHEAILIQLPEGADPMGILDGSIAEADVTFIAVAFPIYPGQTYDLSLVNLDPGVYTLVCFIPGPDGAPHIVNGMVAQFEVVAAAA
ncbi:MAG: hypothetical protein R2839_04985 [Thermomicrobiales bacterium]